MLSFLKKLDRIAGELVGSMDEQISAPVLRTMTGEVFNDGVNSHPRGADAPVSSVATVDNDQTGDLIPRPPSPASIPLALQPDALRA